MTKKKIKESEAEKTEGVIIEGITPIESAGEKAKNEKPKEQKKEAPISKGHKKPKTDLEKEAAPFSCGTRYEEAHAANIRLVQTSLDKAEKAEKTAKAPKPKKEPKPKAYNRAQSLYDALMAHPSGAEPKAIIKKMAESYAKKRGEEINLKEAERFYHSRTDILFLFSVIHVVEGKISVKK